MDLSDKPYWLAVNSFLGIGPLRFKALLDYYGLAKKIWQAPIDELSRVGLGESLVKKFADYRDAFNFDSYLFRLRELGVEAIITEEKTYPERLKQIPAAPPVIYVCSMQYTVSSIRELFESPALAVVGTRKITAYGRQVTEMLVDQLVSAGMVIVSGLMYGVDETAQRTAVQTGGETIGVWAGGLDTVFECSRGSLAGEVVKNGALISEFPLGLIPSKGTFPARNRIVSGLSMGVLVTEGAADSGSMITARYAAEQGREVFAVPGPITSPLSAAASQLIKNGAKLVTSAEDVLEELGINKDPKAHRGKDSEINLSKDERTIYELLENENLLIDEIVRKSGLDTAKIGSILSILELKGIVESLSGGVYSKKI